ncbi:MAG: GTPase HflX, partial [Clostridia bacterium]|nr:GTPase HflX [Clostridia bacterium]
LRELERLLDTAGGVCTALVTQSRPSPEKNGYFGKGKLNEIRTLGEETGADLLVVDDELSPSQISFMEDALDLEVIDRTMLILDIFASHAKSAEGKIQVELAQLRYTAPRLQGKHMELSRLGGGIGTRGPGESKLEIDRRRVREKIRLLEDRLAEVEKNRALLRNNRERSGLKKVAIVGYTNAGKSTLINTLTGAGTYVQDQLFATLDPITRKLSLPDGREVLLTDTVGFVRKLPHHLVSAFRSTLEEAVYSDILLVLCDISDPSFMSELEVTVRLMDELGAGDKIKIFVFNKCDRVESGDVLRTVASAFGKRGEEAVFISAATGAGIPTLLEKISDAVRRGKERVRFRIPLAEASRVSDLYRYCEEVNVAYTNSSVEAEAMANEEALRKLQAYFVGYGSWKETYDESGD